jgi:hypothetical protein
MIIIIIIIIIILGETASRERSLQMTRHDVAACGRMHTPGSHALCTKAQSASDTARMPPASREITHTRRMCQLSSHALSEEKCRSVPGTGPQTDVAKERVQGRNVRSNGRCSVYPAIHTGSRSWLRSSSTHEPSDPPH